MTKRFSNKSQIQREFTVQHFGMVGHALDHMSLHYSLSAVTIGIRAARTAGARPPISPMNRASTMP